MDQQTLLIVSVIFGAFGAAIVALAGFTLLSLRSAARERQSLHTEMYGILRKIEGINASRREQMVRQYDGILENLAARLPKVIATQTSSMIIETEGKVLARLAELEPNLREDDEARKKMDELVRSMEKLEETVVAIAADTVHQVLSESRRELLSDEEKKKVTLAA